MAGCYECNHCGKCTHGSIPIEAPAFVCEECGHVALPGEPVDRCSACGGARMTFKLVASALEN
ncbi:MAG: hypothetical protein IJC51_04140 [Eggerthellaceae bacterium]|nr:hypothetical protein [Eggerthellaceae bacterium]